jgi:hypothetical protein
MTRLKIALLLSIISSSQIYSMSITNTLFLVPKIASTATSCLGYIYSGMHYAIVASDKSRSFINNITKLNISPKIYNICLLTLFVAPHIHKNYIKPFRNDIGYASKPYGYNRRRLSNFEGLCPYKH